MENLSVNNKRKSSCIIFLKKEKEKNTGRLRFATIYIIHSNKNLPLKMPMEVLDFAVVRIFLNESQHCLY